MDRAGEGGSEAAAAANDAQSGVQSLESENARSCRDVNLSLFGARFCLSHLFIIASLIVFVPNIAPLFDAGPPVNSDIGIHYSAIACLDKQELWSLTTALCTHAHAGFPHFQRYAIIFPLLTRFLDWFWPLEFAFKAAMVLGFLVLPSSAYLFLHWIGYPLAGSIAFSFLLLEPGGYLWGGYWIHFLSSHPVPVMENGFALLFILTCMWMLAHPTRLRMFMTSVVGLVTFLSHPAQALLLPIVLVPLGWLYRKEIGAHAKDLVWVPVWTAGMALFWIIPAIRVSSNFKSPGLGGGFFTGEMIRSALSRLMDVQISAIILGLLAASYLVWRSERELRLVGSMVLVIPLLWLFGQVFPSFPYFSFLTIDRTPYELRTFVILSLSLVMAGRHPVFPSRIRKAFRAGCMILVILFLFSFWKIENGMAKNIFTYEDIESAVSPAYRFFEQAQGRIIAESTYFHMEGPLGKTHPWTLAGAVSEKEFLGNGDFWYVDPDYTLANNGILFDTYVWNMTDKEFLDLFDDLNVQYVWTFAPTPWDFSGRLETFLPRVTSFPLPDGKTGNVYEVVGNHSFFKFPAGTIRSYSYNRTKATAVVESPQGGTLLFKVRYWQNWKASVDGKKVPVQPGRWGLMELEIPQGTHDVYFGYGMSGIDWISYLMSIASVGIGMMWVWKDPSRKKGFNTSRKT